MDRQRRLLLPQSRRRRSRHHPDRSPGCRRQLHPARVAMDEYTEPIPAVVMALAASVEQLGPLPPRPIAWHEDAGGWVIVLEDGRKLRFSRDTKPAAAPAAAPTKGKGKK